MIGRSQEERQAGVSAAVTRFRQMLQDAPEHMPRVMPMTAAIAPTFAKRYQEAAIIFDNLHAMHDVVSDILANDLIPHGGKRAAILEAASRYRDDRSFLMPISEWASMGEMMGIANMGGPAVGILPGWPTPTLARGATMVDAMKGMSGMPGMAGMSHGTSGAPATGHSMAGMTMTDSSHAHAMPGMAMGDSTAHAGHTSGMSGMKIGGSDPVMQELHERMLKDPVIRERVMADSAMHRMMMSGMPTVPGTATRKPAPPPANKGARKKAPASKAPAKPMTHDMPGMKHDMAGMKGMSDTKP